MRKKIKTFETLKKNWLKGLPVWVLLPPKVLNQMPVGLIDYLLTNKGLEKPTTEETARFFKTFVIRNTEPPKE